jgi:glucosamine-6-phosphate deaminase
VKECERVRAITRAEITNHPNPDFHIEVIDDAAAFYRAFAEDLVGRIRTARDEGRKFVVILPTGPIPQYDVAAEMINKERLSLAHVHTFAMDEYADEDGETAPASWAGSFQSTMWRHFYGAIDSDLRPPEHQVHFPLTGALAGYGAQMEELGGVEVCYGGVGWCGHVAFFEAHLGYEFAGDLEAFKRAGARLVELNPITIMQEALLSFGGDWSWVPPKANTIGPREVLSARLCSFWQDGALGRAMSWQRFIARLAAYGPVTALVPASILQTVRTDYILLGGVADDVTIDVM